MRQPPPLEEPRQDWPQAVLDRVRAEGHDYRAGVLPGLADARHRLIEHSLSPRVRLAGEAFEVDVVPLDVGPVLPLGERPHSDLRSVQLWMRHNLSRIEVTLLPR